MQQAQKYQDYKDSSIDWIGKIPKSWEIKKIKNFAQYEIGGTPPREKQDYFEGDNLWVSIADLNGKNVILDTYEKLTKEGIDDSNCKLIPKGSLLFSFKLSVGLLAFAGKDLYTNEAIASFLQNNKTNLNYLYYSLQNGFENNARENIYGAKLFNQRSINDSKVAFPPLVEQQKIAEFLDKKTAELDKVLQNKNKQIELLKEYEQILINEAVTKGLDKKAELKESGIDWIGKIPKHWKMRKLKKIANLGDTKEDSLIETKNYLALENIESNTGRLIHATEDILVESSVNLFNKGDVLFCKLRPYLRKFYYCEFDGYCTSELLVFKPYKSNMRFFYYIIQSDYFMSRIDGSTYGAKMPRASPEFVMNELVTFPPIAEQQQIASYLDEKTSKIRRSIDILDKEVEMLKEHKTILINEAVTGKIKVF